MSEEYAELKTIRCTQCTAQKEEDRVPLNNCDMCVQKHTNYAIAMNKPLPETKVCVEVVHDYTGYTEVNLPLYMTWEDVDVVYVKWNTLYISFKDGTTLEQELNDPEPEMVKRPQTRITDEDEEELFEN